MSTPFVNFYNEAAKRITASKINASSLLNSFIATIEATTKDKDVMIFIPYNPSNIRETIVGEAASASLKKVSGKHPPYTSIEEHAFEVATAAIDSKTGFNTVVGDRSEAGILISHTPGKPPLIKEHERIKNAARIIRRLQLIDNPSAPRVPSRTLLPPSVVAPVITASSLFKVYTESVSTLSRVEDGGIVTRDENGNLGLSYPGSVTNTGSTVYEAEINLSPYLITWHTHPLLVERVNKSTVAAPPSGGDVVSVAHNARYGTAAEIVVTVAGVFSIWLTVEAKRLLAATGFFDDIEGLPVFDDDLEGKINSIYLSISENPKFVGDKNDYEDDNPRFKEAIGETTKKAKSVTPEEALRALCAPKPVTFEACREWCRRVSSLKLKDVMSAPGMRKLLGNDFHPLARSIAATNPILFGTDFKTWDEVRERNGFDISGAVNAWVAPVDRLLTGVEDRFGEVTILGGKVIWPADHAKFLITRTVVTSSARGRPFYIQSDYAKYALTLNGLLNDRRQVSLLPTGSSGTAVVRAGATAFFQRTSRYPSTSLDYQFIEDKYKKGEFSKPDTLDENEKAELIKRGWSPDDEDE